MEQRLIPDFIQAQYQARQYGGAFTAATLFVDIAGFTPMTEQLTRRHRDGAETVTAVLKAVFRPTVREVTARGGIIPLFAGDAFAAIFPFAGSGSAAERIDAPQQALQAALAIQRVFTADGLKRTIQTDYGDFPISVKIGLSFGSVQWGIPGNGRRHTFYFRGPAMQACAHAQQRAGENEIIADDLFWQQLNAAVTAVPLTQEPGYYRLEPNLVWSSSAAAPEPQPIAVELQPFIPSEIIDSAAGAEYREVCPLFISFADPVDVQQFHDFVNVVLHLADQYGGYLNQIEFADKGGILLILFGAPVAYENHVERAAEFLGALRRESVAVRWRAGMTSGVLWAGIRGGDVRCEYGVVGDMINLAARLATKADWGRIWVNESVNSRLSAHFWLGSIGAVPVKGKQQGVNVYQLFHEKETADDAFYNLPMVNRERELAQLQERVADSFENRFTGVIHIHGEAGMGKSRLVHALRQQLIGHYYPQTFYCPVESILRSSLNPFKSFLRAYFRQTMQNSVQANRAEFDAVYDFLMQQLPKEGETAVQIKRELARTRSILAAMVDLHLENSLYDELEPKLRFENMLSAFKNLVKAAALSRPVIVHLENAQWLDADSQQMISTLTRNMQDFPVVVLVVTRYLDDGSKLTLALDENVPQSEIELRPLQGMEVREIAQNSLSGAVGDETVSFLMKKSGGNPFFVEQMILDMYERGMLLLEEQANGRFFHIKPGATEDVPTSIKTLLLSRLDRLEVEVRRVVRTATVLGQEFNANLLEYMLPQESDLMRKVTTAEEKQVWLQKNAPIYLFRSALLRDAAYSMQLRARLRLLHRLAAEAIQQAYESDLEPFVADLAYHYDRAEMASAAAYWYQRAGERAASQYANEEAIEYLNRALELLPEAESGARYHLLLARESVYGLQGAREVQQADLTMLATVAAQLNDPDRQAAVALRWAQFAETTGDFEAAVTHAKTAVDLAHQAQAGQREAAAYLAWGRALFRRGEYEAARSQYKTALRLAQAGGALRAEADIHRSMGALVSDLSEYAEARIYYQQALSIYRQLQDRTGESTTLNNLGVASWHLGDYVSANDFYTNARRIYQETGYRRGETILLMNQATFMMEYGDYEQAEATMREMLCVSRDIGERFGECFAYLNLALLNHYQERQQAADDYSRQALALSEKLRARRLQGYAWMNVGHAAFGMLAYERAAKAYTAALAIWQELQQTNLAIEAQAGLARTALQRAALPQAQQYATPVLAQLAADPAMEGVENLFRVYLTAYQVATAVAAADPAAQTLLQTAYDQLMAKANKIEDPQMRRWFLEKVPTHRELVQVYRQQVVNGRAAAQNGRLRDRN